MNEMEKKIEAEFEKSRKTLSSVPMVKVSWNCSSCGASFTTDYPEMTPIEVLESVIREHVKNDVKTLDDAVKKLDATKKEKKQDV